MAAPTDRNADGSIRAGPIEFLKIALAKPVRNDGRVSVFLPRRRRPKKPASFRGAQPFVAIPGIPVRAEIVQIDVT